MFVKFPSMRVGDPVCHESLAVFPLFSKPARHVDYDLSGEAIGRGTVIVNEVSEGGSVPHVRRGRGERKRARTISRRVRSTIRLTNWIFD